MSNQVMPTYFISHGGGPWPWLRKEMPFYDQLEKTLKAIEGALPEKPKAVLMISGHWEEGEFAVMSSSKPSMIYDYGGFPPHTYEIQYNAPGAPELAQRVKALLAEKGFSARLDPERGYDHGTFVPMSVMYPNADVPLIQLSIRKDYDPKTHLEAGRALASLREQGILIIGSGLTYHDLRSFPGGEEAALASKSFDDWLRETLVESTPQKRYAKLLEWSQAPGARKAHPREDHLIPLMVAVGAAMDDPGSLIYHEEKFMGNLTVSSYRFG